MHFYLTGIDEAKHEIYMSAEDKSFEVTINAADEKWTGKETDIEVMPVPNGATVYYTDDNGERSYKNYLFSEEGAREV